MRTADTAVTAAEARSLFFDLKTSPAIVLAVSGGPDSTALMWLAARWRKSLEARPRLIAVTIDHGLRRESKREAADVARLARKLGVAHRTLRWRGGKPKTGVQEAARSARYALLADAARAAGATHILTAHTRDDQAETVLIRMMRGSGVKGLGAMTRQSPRGGLILLRPLLDIPKARLVATLRTARIPFADDPSNRDPKFTRARLRGLMPQLVQEGLDANRLSLLARRMRRADAAIEQATGDAMTRLAVHGGNSETISFEAARFAELPAEVALRLLGRAVAALGDEGPVELAKLEALHEALESAGLAASDTGARFRRSLAGAIVTLAGRQIVVEKAPLRRAKVLTKRAGGKAKRPKAR